MTTRIQVRPWLLVFALLFAVCADVKSTEVDLHGAASRVVAGRDATHALFQACESKFRSVGFDPRFFVFFWDAGRFEVLEGARLALAGDARSSREVDSVVSSPLAPSLDRCGALVRNDVPGHRVIEGVSEEDLESMRNVYRATNPDPHVARDKSLYKDCVKANFNARQLNFEWALQRCDCTLTAMHGVPADQLDGWLARATSGLDVPMHREPWFADLLPKLQACNAR